MKRETTYLIISLLIVFCVAFLLITGNSFLLKPLIEDPYLPWGTILTWIGIISLPLSIYYGNKRIRHPESKFSSFLSRILKINLILAILWVPICFMLAGNLSNTFTEKSTFAGGQLAMKCFWTYSYALVIAPIAILLIHLISLLFLKKKA